MSEIVRPFSVRHREFVTALTGLVNNSELPMVVIEQIMRDVYNDVHKLAEQQYAYEFEQYNKALMEADRPVQADPV